MYHERVVIHFVFFTFVLHSCLHDYMFQTIGEKIAVAGVYRGGTFTPKKFLWQTRTYSIDVITLVSDTRDGAVRRRIYSVLCGKTLYRLSFNRETESWMLEELWVE